MTTIPPPDDAAHQDGLLMHDVTRVNALLGRYVLRFLDADAGRVAPLNTDDERVLAEQVAQVADSLRSRAQRREREGDPLPLIGRRADAVPPCQARPAIEPPPDAEPS